MNRATSLLAGALLLGACSHAGPEKATQRPAASPAPAGAETPPAAACRPPAPFTIRHPAWATTASLYQVNVRQYTPTGHV